MQYQYLSQSIHPFSRVTDALVVDGLEERALAVNMRRGIFHASSKEKQDWNSPEISRRP